MNALDLAQLFRDLTVRTPDEAFLIYSLRGRLEERGIRYRSEVAPVRDAMGRGRDRLDLLVDRVGIEAKVQGSISSVAAQLGRYSEIESIDELLLVTTRPAHRHLPPILGNKRVVVCVLHGSYL